MSSSQEIFGTNQWKLRRQPLVLNDPKQITPTPLVHDKNLRILVSAFVASYDGWPGASYVVARTIITLDHAWAVVTPVAYPAGTNACAVLRWIGTDDVVNRFKLWQDVGEILAYPLYDGRPIPAGSVALEFWCVNDGTSVLTLPEDWYLETTELTLPNNYNDFSLSVMAQSTDLCLTQGETTVAGLLTRCV